MERVTLKKYCAINNRPELLSQWDTEKNLPLTPESVTAGSTRHAWWKDEYGHSWQQNIYSRTALRRGCPICAGREVLAGFNDLATVNPQLATQWDTERNGKLTPRQVSAGSGKKVWWHCDKGHRWQAVISSRSAGCGCPVCAGRVILPGFNDLAATHPELAAEWHPTKNGTLTPRKVSYGYDRKVWWLCKRGHEWQAAPKTRVRMEAGCPICANMTTLAGFNDLETLFPQVAAEWHPTKNAFDRKTTTMILKLRTLFSGHNQRDHSMNTCLSQSQLQKKVRA